ncbi:NAD(P)/FAD-dependent oxidoreductase [Zavarzinia sp. CC-PAN008]|uniref:NAD(P)/FAD-dependent oxidoreductase n=1 Tax=Zavarzinia sp. CC-PAN008 TaxID=3243332 RepID=UPI003F743424
MAQHNSPDLAVIGGGPAGLMAAEVAALAGRRVVVLERMPSLARRLLMAGRGGLNLTHSEDFAAFLARYGGAADWLEPVLRAFPPAALVAWAEGLGQTTFVGSSGRVFPHAMKASPLLRAWIARLDGLGVDVRTRHDWTGWDGDGALTGRGPDGAAWTIRPRATVLALGGASWPRLGADGTWVPVLAGQGVATRPLRPANCGIDIAWSPYLKARFAGTPLKTVGLSAAGRSHRGEAVLTAYGLEGGAVYRLAAAVRDALGGGPVALHLDLRPNETGEALALRLDRPQGRQSLASHLKRTLGLTPVAIALLHEGLGREVPRSPVALARAIKAVPLTISGVQGLARAISTAGGVALEALDDRLMLRARPGVFVAGEMLDWEAPTGGYLLQASFATGAAAAHGALHWLAEQERGSRGVLS